MNSAASSGITLSASVAVAISWSLHHSVLLAFVHGFFGLFYVIYYVVTR